MAYTPKIVSSEKSVRNSVLQAEWGARVDLAAAYRYAALRGWNEGIYNHITVRVPDEPQHLLIKPHELVFEEVSASNLIKLDMQGNPVGEAVAINPAAATIHTAVLVPRPEINAVMHLHSRAGVAISVLKMGLRCLNQEGMTFYNRVGYHDFEGVATDMEECGRIARNLGTHKALILRNHGLLNLRREYRRGGGQNEAADQSRRDSARPDGLGWRADRAAGGTVREDRATARSPDRAQPVSSGMGGGAARARSGRRVLSRLNDRFFALLLNRPVHESFLSRGVDEFGCCF